MHVTISSELVTGIKYWSLPPQDSGPKPLKYGEVAYAHTSPFLGILPPGATQSVVENNMYRAPIYEHTLPSTDFLVIRTRYGHRIRNSTSTSGHSYFHNPKTMNVILRPNEFKLDRLAS